MSNIERRYAYLDEGTFPEEGEYGVTYLTLYSSNAGNNYDGWVYDPDNKIEESLTERTYGYRNPDYPQYCWDDEVTVDLSNAQNRQESSEFEQGRITSFNTNVSSTPIILEDIDITGLTEEEREEKATVVLFSAIPLVNDAYIHAEVEIQAKVTISPDNTTGTVRVEAFYILNDESDRTMRPHPIYHHMVASDNEYTTFRFLYWNPALKHEDHNYIGVKLLVTGGTAEIGISDDPDYGDAIITLTSAGLVGDRIDGGRPIYLEIFGREEVVGGYVLDPDDYTVLCTYDTGEIYEVTRMCEFTPAMGTEITESVTTLTAYYQHLRASMTVRLGMVESIELMGREDIYGSYTLKLVDYTVLAYLDNGDIMDVTGECTFSPAMGTTINSNTTLTATYQPYWMGGASFTDSIDIVSHGEPIATASPNNGLVYSLFSEGHIMITGNSHLVIDADNEEWEAIELPNIIRSAMHSGTEYSVEWAAEGCISGITLNDMDVSFLKGFKDVVLKPKYIKRPIHSENYITINFANNHTIKSDDLMFLTNMDLDAYARSWGGRVSVNHNLWGSKFIYCRNLTHLDFLSKIQLRDADWNTPVFTATFMGCTNLSDISGISHLDMSYTSQTNQMLYGCESLYSAEALSDWKLYNVYTAERMFENSGLETLEGLGNLEIGRDYKRDHPDSSINVNYCFSNTRITNVEGISNWFNQNSSIEITAYMCRNCTRLETLRGSENWDMRKIKASSGMYEGCINLTNINQSASWVFHDGFGADRMFLGDDKIESISVVNNWIGNCSSAKDFLKIYDPSAFVHTNGTTIFRPTDADTEGMFSGRDAWSYVEDPPGFKIGIHFTYPECTPQWYKEDISAEVGYPII